MANTECPSWQPNQERRSFFLPPDAETIRDPGYLRARIEHALTRGQKVAHQGPASELAVLKVWLEDFIDDLRAVRTVKENNS